MRKVKRYLVTIDNELNIIKSDKAFLSYLHLPELSNLDQVIPSPDITQFRDCVAAIAAESTDLTCFRVKIGDDSFSWMAANIDKAADPKAPIHVELSDIQALKSGSADSYYDKMTGLLNKNSITDYAADLMQDTNHEPFYFFLMDIDNFKSINDTFGHMKGDEIITEIAHLTKEIVGESGVIGRIGGDEFMMVLENVHTEQDLRKILMNIRKSVEEKYSDMGENISTSVSMGGALFPTDAMDYESMFMLADKMLYMAKTKGRNRYIFYTPLIHGKVHYDGKVMTISQNMMMNREKSFLMMNTMDSLFLKKDISPEEAFERIIVGYSLDEIHEVDETGEKSCFSLQLNPDKDGNVFFTHNELDIPFIKSGELDDMFDTSPIAVLGYDLDKEKKPRIASFMKKNDLRVIVAYRMRLGKRPGYIMYMNHTQSSCRLSLTDLADLTYYSHMIEISGQCN